MKKLVIAAALLLTASAAQAGGSYSFEIGGRTVHIHAPRGCDSPSCISISIPGVYDSGRKDFDNDDSEYPGCATGRRAAGSSRTSLCAGNPCNRDPLPLSHPPAIVTPAPAIVTPAPVQQAATPTAASNPGRYAAPQPNPA